MEQNGTLGLGADGLNSKDKQSVRPSRVTLETASENAGRAALKAKNTSTSKKPWNASFRSTHSDVAKQGLSKCRVECAEASPSSTDRRGLRQRAQNSRQRVIDEQSVSGCGDLGLVAEKKKRKIAGGSRAPNAAIGT